MAEPFIGEIRMFGFNWAPVTWAICEGTLLTIKQNAALYSLLGTMYGGDGRVNFALPDLRGRVPVHSYSYTQGTMGGLEQVVLSVAAMANHTHDFDAQPLEGDQINIGVNSDRTLAKASSGADMYGTSTNPVQLNAESTTAAGSGLPHSNLQPSLVASFCIALQGLFPSRN